MEMLVSYIRQYVFVINITAVGWLIHCVKEIDWKRLLYNLN